MENIKVAVLLSGHTRTYEQTHQSLFDCVLPSINADFFIHTWDTSGRVIKVHHDYDTDSVNVDKVKEIYKPKRMVIENQQFLRENSNTDRFIGRTPPQMSSFNIFSQWYSVWKSMLEFLDYTTQTGERYGLVIRARVDVKFLSNLGIISRLDWFREPNKIVTAARERFGSIPQYICNDSFACGTKDVIVKYCSLYTAFNDIFESQQYIIPFHPETMLGWHLSRNGIDWNSKTFDFNYELLR